MVFRVLAGSTGVFSAAIMWQAVEASPAPVAFAWSAIAGIASAGVTYGVLTSKVNAAHARISAEKMDRTAAILAEKLDREAAVMALKTDMNRGFDGIEKRLEEQTRTVIDAMERLAGHK